MLFNRFWTKTSSASFSVILNFLMEIFGEHNKDTCTYLLIKFSGNPFFSKIDQNAKAIVHAFFYRFWTKTSSASFSVILDFLMEIFGEHNKDTCTYLQIKFSGNPFFSKIGQNTKAI